MQSGQQYELVAKVPGFFGGDIFDIYFFLLTVPPLLLLSLSLVSSWALLVSDLPDVDMFRDVALYIT